MENRLTCLLDSKKGPVSVAVFGYSSNSNPGLDLVGEAKFTRQLKEKIIYLTRTRKLAIPLRRYVVTIESELNSKLSLAELRNLELPVLLIFWSMAGVLPIRSFRDCLCMGSIDITGMIETPFWNYTQCLNLANQEHILITSDGNVDWPKIIELERLLEHVPKLKWRVS
jgi:hypothetical protein